LAIGSPSLSHRAANWPRSQPRELERGLPINMPTAEHCPRDAGTGNAAQLTGTGF
jgi:hypothetical protein